MLEYVLIIAGIIMLFVTILPPTWQIDLGTFALGILLMIQGVRMLNREKEENTL
jgi:hypothetical protein